eukprot:TRINITY_DN62426_c0_g1_i1.p1 TRINITY_DN62426_c0_g1~~TRINITY_DN62426_c0_g1_i1.p1  ORF type:complete len:1017 (+),score=202.00 TRINITY_DN62426_c0_g1_i1:53-3103(+)
MDHTYVGISLLEERAYSGLQFRLHEDENRLYLEENVFGCLVPSLQELIQAVNMKQEEEQNENLIRTPDMNPIDWLASLLMRNNPRHNYQAATHPYNAMLQDHARRLRAQLEAKRAEEDQQRLAEEARKREEESRLLEAQRKKEEEEERKRRKEKEKEEEKKRKEQEKLDAEAEAARKAKEAKEEAARKRAAKKAEEEAAKQRALDAQQAQTTEQEESTPEQPPATEEPPTEEKEEKTEEPVEPPAEEPTEEKQVEQEEPTEAAQDTDEQKMERWRQLKEKLAQKQQSDMEAFLEWLQKEAEGVSGLQQLSTLHDTVVQKLSAIMNGVAFYIADWDRNADELVYTHASDNCSDGMKSGSTKLQRVKNPMAPTFQAVDASSAMHLPNLVQSTDLKLLSTFENPLGPAGDGDMFAGAILGAANQTAAVLCSDTLTSNNRTVSDEEAEIWGSEGAPAEYRPFENEEMTFLQSAADILSQAQLNALTADALMKIKEASNSDVLKAFHQAVDALFQYFGPKSNVYISNFSKPTEDQTLCTVVAQSCAPGGGHSQMVGKVLSSTSPNGGLAFHFTSTDENTYYIPNVVEEPTVGIYVNSNQIDDGSVTPDKPEECLLLIAIRDNKGSPVGVLGVEHEPNAFTQKELTVTETVAKLLGDLMLPLYQKKLMTDLAQQALQWVEANTCANNVYFSMLDAAANLRYVAANKGQEFLLGKVLGSSEGVSHKTLESGEVLHIPDTSADGNIKLWEPSKKEQKAHAAFAPVKGKSGQGGVLGCDTLDGSGKPLTEPDLAVLKQTAELLAGIFDEVMDGSIDENADDHQLAIEKLMGPKAIRFLKKIWLHLREELNKLTKDQLLEMAGYKAPPETIVTVVRGTCVLLGSKPSKVKEWGQCRPKLKPPILKKIADYDATKKSKKAKYIFTKKLLKGLTVDSVRSRGSVPTSIFFEWAHLSIQLFSAASKMRRRMKQGGLNMLEEMMPTVSFLGTDSEMATTEDDDEDATTEGGTEDEEAEDEDEGADDDAEQ